MIKRILLVENEQQVAYALRDLLEHCGYDVTYSENGQEALSFLEIGTFDLIISDVLMPVMDGFELVCKARKAHYNCKFLAISGGGKIEKEYYLDAISKFGADGVLAKPFTIQQLVSKMKELEGN